MPTLNKNDLATRVAEETDLDTGQAKLALEKTLEVVARELAAGNEVSNSGFGKFSVGERSAREGRNPSTGETIQIAASRGAKFSAAKALKDQLNADS
jgi:DNA-binding protein HU-beta